MRSCEPKICVLNNMQVKNPWTMKALEVKPVEGKGKLDPKFCVQFLDAASKTSHFTPHRPSRPSKLLHPGAEKAQMCANTHNLVAFTSYAGNTFTFTF